MNFPGLYVPPPPRAASPAEAVTGPYAVAGGAPLLRARPIRILLAGDSLTMEEQFRRRLWRALRRLRGGVRFLGDLGWRTVVTGGHVGNPALGDWHHSGVGGDTCEEITARLPGLAQHLEDSGQGAPDFVVIRSGTNNVAPEPELAVILAAKGAELDTARELWPEATIVVPSIPIWGPGAGAGWEDKAALRDAYVAALPALCASKGRRVVFVDDCSGMVIPELSDDGVHPLGDGYQRMAEALGTALDRMAGARYGDAHPLWHRPRPLQASLYLAADTDYVSFAYDANLSPASGSFALTFWLRLDALPSSFSTVYQYGDAYTDGFMVGVDGDGTGCYLAGDAGPVIAANAGYSNAMLAAATWHHLAFVFDRGNRSVGIAIDGRTVFGGKDVTGLGWEDWEITAQHGTRIGAAGGLPGVVGLIDNIRLYKGAAAPTIHDLNAFAELECFTGLAWGDPSVALRCDEGTGTALNDWRGHVNAGTLHGTADWDMFAKPFSE